MMTPPLAADARRPPLSTSRRCSGVHALPATSLFAAVTRSFPGTQRSRRAAARLVALSPASKPMPAALPSAALGTATTATATTSTAADASFRSAVDLIGGGVGGALLAIVGHPLDTVKSRLQNQGALSARGGASSAASQVVYSGPLDAVRTMLRQEGLRGFYKGLSSPLTMTPLLNAVLFTVNSVCKETVAAARGKASPSELNVPEVVAAALMTAPLYCAFVCPVDTVKIRLQLQASDTQRTYTGALDCIRKTLQSEGVPGLMRGYTATVGMRMVGLPFYFTSFELVKRRMMEREGPGAKVGPGVALTAGGVAGTMFWVATFPLDSIKTRLQGAEAGSTRSPVAVARAMYAAEGARGFYRGFVPCVLRAAPANAAAFLGLELTRRVAGL